MVSLKSRYGLKAVIALANNYGGGYIQAKEIAEQQGIPIRYLEFLLSQLRKARIVSATRGKNGGYIFAVDPARVTVWDIVKVFEGEILFADPESIIVEKRTPDPGNSIWEKAGKRMVDYFNSIKISDLLESANSEVKTTTEK